MSATQSPRTCIAFRTPRPERASSTASRSGSEGDGMSITVLDETHLAMQNRFGEQFRSSGIDISPEECCELRVFDEFLARHVQPNRVYDVQCMLLWSEWVRTLRRQVHGFPKLILEKEFLNVIAEKFGVTITEDGSRGAVYPGIRFVP